MLPKRPTHVVRRPGASEKRVPEGKKRAPGGEQAERRRRHQNENAADRKQPGRRWWRWLVEGKGEEGSALESWWANAKGVGPSAGASTTNAAST